LYDGVLRVIPLDKDNSELKGTDIQYVPALASLS
jgi:hypothetical protein